MRRFEVLTLGVLLLIILSLLVPRSKRPRWAAFLPSLALLLLLVHLVLEGYRWQMVPAYGLAALLFLTTVRYIVPGSDPERPPSSLKRTALSIGGAILALPVLAIAAALPAVFPVFQLPEPTGPHAVGTRHFYWVDEGRPDAYSPEPGDYREISLQMWYPALPRGDEKTVPYMNTDAAEAFAAYGTDAALPSFIWKYITLVGTHSYLNAPVADSESPFPVVLFSPSGLMSASTALSEELASHGYVVLTVGHPYWNPFYFDADGDIIPFDGNNEQYKAIWQELDDPAWARLEREVLRAHTQNARKRKYTQINQRFPASANDVRLWASDTGFVIDKLDTMNRGTGFLAGKLNLGQIGVMGFSKGGAAAVQFCATDDRCKAAINMDGRMYGDVVEHNLTQPFLLMASHMPGHSTETTTTTYFYDNAEGPAYNLFISGAKHSNFGDVSLLGGLLKLAGELGPINGQRCVEIQNVYTQAFFDRHLKGSSATSLEGLSADYPEVVFRSRNNGRPSEEKTGCCVKAMYR